jgi:hypothetical protein
MGTVVAKGTYRVAGPPGRSRIIEGKAYDEKDPLVKAHPDLFDMPEQAAKRQSKPTSTAELGAKSMSARTRRQKPGQSTSAPKGDG